MILVLMLIGEASISGANETHLWLETPGWATQFYNETSTDLYVGDFRVGGRFLLDAENLRDTLNRIAVTHRYLSYQGDEFSLWLGNYFKTPGYGLVLSSFEDKALRIDRNMDGGYLEWGNDWLELEALAGRMLEADKVTRDEWLYAAEVTVLPFDFADVGVIYLRRDATEDADTLFGRAFEEWTEENVTLRVGKFDISLASAQRFTWGRRSAEGWIGVDNVLGLGFNSSVSYARKGIGILLEGKFYRGLAGGINAPPPANPDGESINEGADEFGLHALVDFAPVHWLWFTGSYAYARDSTGQSSLQRIGAETRLDVAGHTFIPFFTLIDREIPGALNPQNDMLEAGLSYETLIGMVSLHLKPYYRLITEAETWHEPRILAEVGWGSFLFSAGGVYEVHEVAEDNQLWPWGSVRYTAYPFDLTLSYGRLKGEYICKNGVCSYELPFEGLKADLTLYF